MSHPQEPIYTLYIAPPLAAQRLSELTILYLTRIVSTTRNKAAESPVLAPVTDIREASSAPEVLKLNKILSLKLK